MISTLRLVSNAVHFAALRGQYVLLRKACNQAVALHVRFTPKSATPDTFNEIVLEQLGALVRRIEFRCYTIQERYNELGEEILHGTTSTEDAYQTAEDET